MQSRDVQFPATLQVTEQQIDLSALTKHNAASI